ncbi:hypothetical protein GLOTRDRAFT_141261 [Gloeophyllum trabeum ATCC 11539]|uniref:P-loop containing nucleoside triphosphate hydrolase protein n=1 Tax=Gloeophyllum trabeum (strain ATCC 11539 / FP-39264 / Madison 617) TaxID=670483 RepID=S7RA73_GLOTA|nr:uncharacterized protein GLOTRDRAFT_141261 [Gloeophyllum trabeum ATCC 11539]EPQ51165.1 hypothetical protein GLOTRDRAFT_141261 [Gloeophyllum trabeum ATCC 11539]
MPEAYVRRAWLCRATPAMIERLITCFRSSTYLPLSSSELTDETAMGKDTVSELSSSEYASRRKELLKLVKQLRAIGAQAELDLPCIAVIGNQSAGKSSVVEAISGIKVPRDAGTCTRCPMECRLSSSDMPWKCQISIRWEFDDKGKRRDDVQEVPFGGAITNKGDVELALRRAQAAVLNPSVSPSKFLLMSADHLKAPAGTRKTLDFSRNVVCVDLVGPDLTDLSFIDLPGTYSPNAEPEIVKLVEDLVVSHIQGNCLILVALPMTDDIENQKALRLAHQVDPKGLRTIGVLTKPDMLTSGATKARDLWMDVIEGRRHPLLNGYYCTRQPDDAERAKDISAAEARKVEADFFGNTIPWSRATNKNRFGTGNLVATLSKLLTKLIDERLPHLHKQAKEVLRDCNEELDSLPQAIEAEPATYVLGLITAFSTNVQGFVAGGLDSGRLVHENRDSFREFKYAVRRTAPNFIPYPEGTISSAVFENYIGDGEDEGPAEGLVSAQAPVYLTDMLQHIEKSITRELPDDVPFPCKVSLIKAFQTTWRPSAMVCFERVRASVINLLHDMMKDQFDRYDALHIVLRGYVADLVHKHQVLCLQRIGEMLEIESEPFTQNGHYYDSCRDKWLAKYKDARAGKLPVSQERPAKVRKLSQQTAGAPPAASATSFTFQSLNGQQSTSSGFRGTPSPFSSIATLAGSTSTPSTATPFAFKPGAFGAGPAPASPQQSATHLKTSSTKEKAKANGMRASLHAPTSSEDSSGSDDSTVSSSSAEEPRMTTVTKPVLSQPTLSEEDQAKVNAALAALADIGYTGITQEDLGKLNPPDEFAREINVMAQVRAYFQVSYKRVIDNVPLMIDHKFVRAIAKDLQSSLISQLGLGTANASTRCATYLAEDPHVVARREELIARKKRLEGVTKELSNFGLKSA